MKAFACVLLLLSSAVPAFAQSKLYTNADLVSRVTWRRTVTELELAGLEARQFRLPPPVPLDGPTVVIIPSTPLFAPWEPTRPIAEPWSMTTYVGRGYGRGSHGSGRRGHGRP